MGTHLICRDSHQYYACKEIRVHKDLSQQHAHVYMYIPFSNVISSYDIFEDCIFSDGLMYVFCVFSVEKYR